MRKQIANRLGAAHIRDMVQQFVAGEIDRHQAMESLQIGKSNFAGTVPLRTLRGQSPCGDSNLKKS